MSSIQLVFGGCGGLYNYYLGFAAVLQEKFDLSNTIFTGSSAGSFPAYYLAANKNIRQSFHDINIPLLKEVNQYKLGAFGVWNRIVKQHMAKHITKKDHKQVANKLGISASKWSSVFCFDNEIIYHWKNKDELMDTLMASAFVPCFDIGKLSYKIKDTCYVDGSLTNGCPILDNTIPYFYMHVNKWRTFSYYEMWCWSNPKWAKQMFELGENDANRNIQELEMYFTLKH